MEPDMSVPVTAPAVAAIMIRARSVRTMARWYAEVLGVAFDLEADGRRFAEIAGEAGPLRIAIVPAPDRMPPTAISPVTLTFQVTNFEARVERLRAAGESFVVEDNPGFGPFAYLRDPEGNELAIFAPAAADQTS